MSMSMENYSNTRRCFTVAIRILQMLSAFVYPEPNIEWLTLILAT